MSDRKRFRLTDLDLDRVDIVDVPANQGAEIVIAKGMPGLSDVHVESAARRRKPGKGKYDRPNMPAEGVLRGGSRMFEGSDEEEDEEGDDGEVPGRWRAPGEGAMRPRAERKKRMAKRIAKAGAMTPDENTKKPPAPVAQPTPAAPKPPTTGGPGTPPQPMAPGGGLNQKPASPAPLGGGAMNPAAPGAPMAPGMPPGGPMGAEFGAKPGMPRLQRLTPDMFEMTADSQTHKEWSLKPEALPDNMEAVVVSMMSDGDGARYQWMMDPLDGPPQTGQSKTAPEAMMALRDALTSYVATSAMQFMGGAAPLGMPGAPGMPGAGMPGAGAPGAPMPGGPQRPPAAPGAPAPPAAGGSEGSKPAAGGGLLERLRASMGKPGGSPAGPAAGESRPKPAGGSNPAAPKPAPKPEEKLRKALDLIARDFAEMDLVKADTSGGDLRDILSSRTLESLSSMVSATKSADVEGASMPIDIDALAAQLPDEVLDYIEGLEGEVERLSEVTKSLNPSILPQDAIAKALETLPPDVAAIVKADRERTERLEKALADERIAKANSEWIAKASTLAVVEDPATLGTKLRSLAEFDSDLADEVFKALDLANRQVNAGSLFAEFGKSGGASGAGAEAKIEAIAKGYRDADPTLSDEVARAMAYENNPEVYAEYLAERRGR